MSTIFLTLCVLILGSCIACCLGVLTYLIVHKLLYLDALLTPLIVLDDILKGDCYEALL